MFFPTRLDDETMILIEAPTSGAFTKSELETDADPVNALLNAIELTAQVGRQIGRQIGPALARTGCIGDVEFGIAVNEQGYCMVAGKPDEGQIKCTVRYVPRKSG